MAYSWQAGSQKGMQLKMQSRAVSLFYSVDPEWGQISIAPGCNLGYIRCERPTPKGLNRIVKGAITKKKPVDTVVWFFERISAGELIDRKYHGCSSVSHYTQPTV